MSQDSKLRYDQMRGNNNFDADDSAIKSQDKNYSVVGNNRNICFVTGTGEALFLNYAYLVSGKFDPTENSIILKFTTHEISMKGKDLQQLFFQIMNQLPRVIETKNERYSVLSEESETQVFIISITAT